MTSPQTDSPPPTDGPPSHTVGPESLKALAHPLRVQLLTELSDRGRATATQLAQALGESSGATSYHLRQLHRHGLIEEDTAAGTGRERYWRPIPGGWELPVFDFMDDDANRAAVGLVLREHLQQDVRRALATVEAARSWPKPWQDVVRRVETHVTLSAAQVEDLHRDVDAVLRRYRELPAGEGARRVIITVNTTPTEHRGIDGG